MKWRKGSKPELFLNDILKCRTVGEKVSFSFHASDGFDKIDRVVSILSTNLIELDISTSIKEMAIRKTLSDPEFCEIQKFPNAFHKNLNKLKRENQKFWVIFPVYGELAYLVGRQKIGSVYLNLEPSQKSSFFRKVVFERQKQVESRPNFFLNSSRDLAKSRLVVCTCAAFSEYEAHELALRAIKQYLGSIGYFSRLSSRIYSGPLKPINKLLVAPHVTVHHSNGKLAHDGFWYHTWFPKSQFSAPTKNRNDNALKNSISCLSHLKKLPWEREARDLLVQYYDAFSEHEPSESFKSAWRILEIVGGDRNASYDVLVNRAANMFSKVAEYREIGNHLKIRRNSMTHDLSDSSNDGETLSFQLLEFIAPIVLMFLRNSFCLNSKEEFWSFCDLPASKSERAQLIMQLQRAEKFRYNG